MRFSQLSCALLLAGCSASLGARAATSVSDAGVLTPGGTLILDAGVSDVTVHLGAGRDSVHWSLRTNPQGCARPDVLPSRLGIKDRARHCSTKWEISGAAIADVSVDVSVGNITLSAPSDRAVKLHAGVGDIKLRLDGRELRHSGAPGSGDELELGDANTQPRLVARTGVGSITLDLRTTP